MVGLDSRATMDMNVTIKGYPADEDNTRSLIENFIAVPVDDDISFRFRSNSISDRAVVIVSLNDALMMYPTVPK